MRILKVLYVCWIIFWGLACILGSVMGEWGYREVNEIFNTMLFLYFLLCLFPLLPYFYYLIYEKTKSKNIFVAVCCYLLLFVAIAYYFTLIGSSVTLEFFIVVTLYTIICIVTILWKFKINLRLYFYIFLHIFMRNYEIKWSEILFDRDIRMYMMEAFLKIFM